MKHVVRKNNDIICMGPSRKLIIRDGKKNKLSFAGFSCRSKKNLNYFKSFVTKNGVKILDFQNPYLNKEACEFLCDCGMKALCMDHPIDPGMKPGGKASKGDSPGHRTVLGNGIPLIEHVINLDSFDEVECEIFAFPVKLYKIEGAPARVVARIP